MNESKLPAGFPSELKFIKPAKGIITSYFEYRDNPLNPTQRQLHDGWDIGHDHGLEIFAAESGHVFWAGNADDGYGNKIIIEHNGRVISLYGHLEKILVNRTDQVVKGQIIGIMGTTGNSTGVHLHFGIYTKFGGEAVNPALLIKE